jgi:hypothetical protein
MAPEQITGTTDQPSIDIYGMGCIGYELVCGEPPFPARRLTELCHAHLTTPPEPPTQRAPDAGIPPQLEAILLCCLEKDPRRRFASAAALAYALRQLATAMQRDHNTSNAGSDFHDTSTMTAFPAPAAALRAAAREEQAERTVAERCRGLVALAQSLLARGVSTPGLIVALSELEDLLAEQRLIDAEVMLFRRLRDEFEQVMREREGRLRFCLSELGLHNAASSQTWVNRATERLLKLDRERPQELERIDQAFARVENGQIRLQRELSEQYAVLEEVVKQEVVPHLNDHSVASLWKQLRSARPKKS